MQVLHGIFQICLIFKKKIIYPYEEYKEKHNNTNSQLNQILKKIDFFIDHNFY